MDVVSPEEEPTIVTRGDGDIVAAVVGGVHGDEPSGVQAVEGILADESAGRLSLTAAVRFITAHPTAVAAGRRFIEVDLNRSFPGNRDGLLEERLATVICDAVADVPTLALHSTRSQGTPFAFAAANDPAAIELARSLSVPNLVLADGSEVGALSACGTVITVEVGPQGSSVAAETARELTDEFLVATGAMAGTVSPSDPAVFQLGEELERPTGERYESLADNFERVATGEAYATVDGEQLVADESFYPILLSATGYADILGFRGEKLANSVGDLDRPVDR